MVTTIKITCDGVFIQSNSYLTNPVPLRRQTTQQQQQQQHIRHHSTDNLIGESDRGERGGKKFTISFLNARHPKLLTPKKNLSLTLGSSGGGSCCDDTSDSSISSSGIGGCSCDSAANISGKQKASDESDIVDGNNNNSKKIDCKETDLYYVTLDHIHKSENSNNNQLHSSSVLSNNKSTLSHEPSGETTNIG